MELMLNVAIEVESYSLLVVLFGSTHDLTVTFKVAVILITSILKPSHSLFIPDWYEGLVTEYLVATFADYFMDVKM